MILKSVFIIAICFSQLSGFARNATAFSESELAFFQLVGKTDWKMSLKNFAVSLEKEEAVFKLRVGDGHYLGFSAHQKKDENQNRFGPLQLKYTAHLSGLLEYALAFAEQDKNDKFAMNMNWEMYPASIQKWAKVWQDSNLRKNWGKLDQHIRYKKLVNMISAFIKKDMQAVAQALGFEATGASMEKMSFQKADQLKYYKDVLKPIGIPRDLKIPIPMMLSVLLKPSQNATLVQGTRAASANSIFVDSLFAVAKKNSTTVYCSFQRALDEYEITGDKTKPDGTYVRILPMSQKAYQSISTRLLKACLQATRGDKKKFISLRINLKLYPEVYQEVIKHFTYMPKTASKVIKPRPQLPHLRFHTYVPPLVTGFKSAVNPFLEHNGYKFKNLQICLDSRRKAASYPEYEKTFKPLGINPNDKPSVPDIVYMVVEK